MLDADSQFALPIGIAGVEATQPPHDLDLLAMRGAGAGRVAGLQLHVADALQIDRDIVLPLDVAGTAALVGGCSIFAIDASR